MIPLRRLSRVPVEIKHQYILVFWIVYSTGIMPGTRSQMEKSKSATAVPGANTGSSTTTASATTGNSITSPARSTTSSTSSSDSDRVITV